MFKIANNMALLEQETQTRGVVGNAQGGQDPGIGEFMSQDFY